MEEQCAAVLIVVEPKFQTSLHFGQRRLAGARDFLPMSSLVWVEVSYRHRNKKTAARPASRGRNEGLPPYPARFTARQKVSPALLSAQTGKVLLSQPKLNLVSTYKHPGTITVYELQSQQLLIIIVECFQFIISGDDGMWNTICERTNVVRNTQFQPASRTSCDTSQRPPRSTLATCLLGPSPSPHNTRSH